MKYCEIRTAKKVTKEGNNYKSKYRIPRLVRLNMRREQLGTVALKKAKTAERCRKLKEKISQAEKEISKSYFSYKVNKENYAIDKMKENKKYFFTYFKKKQNDKGKMIYNNQ